MKPYLNCFIISFCLIILSCNKNRCTDPPADDTPASPVIEGITYRHLENNNLVEDIYAFTYDENGRLTGCNRVDQDLPVIKVNYTGSDLSYVQKFTPTGIEGPICRANESLFIGKDSISFHHIVDLYSPDPFDTVFQTYYFKDSALQKGTFRYGSMRDIYRNTYDNKICKYDGDGNLIELGYMNWHHEYIKHMEVTGFDDKINPIRYVSPVAFAFVIVNIDLELVTGINNIKAVKYADGSTAELEYTYNVEGFPLTVKQKDQSFIKYEFRYRQ
jgi:hypothetical protein